jgi:sec-independent protein translocase protein TatC
MATQETNTLWSHLNELRKRLVICLIAIAAGIILALIFADKLFQILIWPVPGIKLIFIDVTEMLGTYMQVCLVAGIIVAMPVIVYQLIAFVTPALNQREKKYIWVILPFVIIMFAGGVAFSYFVLLPPALQFLITFGSDIATPEIRIGNYVSLVGRLLLATGIIFETPVITTFLARIGVVSSKGLAKGRKWAIVAAFILGAIITPTLDPVNQTLVALPLIVLYEISIWLAKLVEKRRINNPGLTSS